MPPQKDGFVFQEQTGCYGEMLFLVKECMFEMLKLDGCLKLGGRCLLDI